MSRWHMYDLKDQYTMMSAVRQMQLYQNEIVRLQEARAKINATENKFSEILKNFEDDGSSKWPGRPPLQGAGDLVLDVIKDMQEIVEAYQQQIELHEIRKQQQ